MKKLLLLIALIAYSTSVFSQLFVRPNPSNSTDSYVYVSNEILFVEQDVNLQINTNDPDTKASVYLRDEGQLIQGNSPTNPHLINNGTGMLSVQQTNPGSDAWDYTYWCSPVGAQYMNGGSAGNKNFSIQRIFESDDPMTSKTNAVRSDFTANYNGFNDPKLTISKRWIYTHVSPGTEAEGAYQHVGQWHNIPPGYGFTMKGVNNGGITGNNDTSGAGNHDQTYDFRGRPNNGTFSYPVAAPVSGVAQMTLAGNPYPSAIDLADVVNNNSNVNAIWFYDEDRGIDSHYYTEKRYGYGTWIPGGIVTIPPEDGGGFTGTYAAPTFREWDASGGTGGGGTGGTGADYQRRFSPIGQGFMIIGNASGTATIDNSMREFRKESEGYSVFRSSETNNNANFNRNDGGLTGSRPGPDPDPEPILNGSQLRIVTTFGESHQREMILLFNENTTNGYDHGWDAMHPMDATSEIFFPIDHNGIENPYVIQTVPFNRSQAIPVSIKVNRGFKVGIRIVEEINFHETAYFHDQLYNTYMPITDGNEAGVYLDTGLYEDRFFIVFENEREVLEESEGTKVKEEARANVDFFQNNPLKQLEIRNPEGYDIKSAMVYDMAGKLVINKTNLGNNNIITLSTSNMADGIYLVQLVTSENINIDYKMIIQNN